MPSRPPSSSSEASVTPHSANAEERVVSAFEVVTTEWETAAHAAKYVSEQFFRLLVCELVALAAWEASVERGSSSRLSLAAIVWISSNFQAFFAILVINISFLGIV